MASHTQRNIYELDCDSFSYIIIYIHTEQMTEMAALMQGPPGPPGRSRPGRPGSPGPQGRPGTSSSQSYQTFALFTSLWHNINRIKNQLLRRFFC